MTNDLMSLKANLKNILRSYFMENINTILSIVTSILSILSIGFNGFVLSKITKVNIANEENIKQSSKSKHGNINQTINNK